MSQMPLSPAAPPTATAVAVIPPAVKADDEIVQSPKSSLCATDGCCSIFCRILQFCHTIAIIVLVACVVILFAQVQYLAYQVSTDEVHLTDLEGRLQNQTQQQIEVLNDKVEQEQDLTLYQMAGTFALLACLLTMFHMSSHLRNYHEPIVQRKIVAILWLSPIYAVTSFLSLVFPRTQGYLAVIKDFYEAYAIYSFLAFLIAVLGRGDRQVAVQVLSKHASHLSRPYRCLNGFYSPPPETSDTAMASAVLTECQILAMQFVFVRPFTSIVSFVSTVLSHGDTDDDRPYFKTPSFYCAMITNISVFLAFTGLLKFYHAVRDDLAWCQPLSKFITIKAIVFLTFWQGLVISIVVAWQYSQSAATAATTDYDVAGTTQQHTRFLEDEFNDSSLPNYDPNEYLSSTLAPASLATYVSLTLAPTSLPAEGDNYTSVGSSSSSSSGSSPSSSSSSSSFFDAANNQAADDEANQIQNFLICLEMLFFSIAHWCVFPAEEWEPDYCEKQRLQQERQQQACEKEGHGDDNDDDGEFINEKGTRAPNNQHHHHHLHHQPKLPGIGVRDFVHDIGQIMSSRSAARSYRKRATGRYGQWDPNHPPVVDAYSDGEADDDEDHDDDTNDTNDEIIPTNRRGGYRPRRPTFRRSRATSKMNSAAANAAAGTSNSCSFQSRQVYYAAAPVVVATAASSISSNDDCRFVMQQQQQNTDDNDDDSIQKMKHDTVVGNSGLRSQLGHVNYNNQQQQPRGSRPQQQQQQQQKQRHSYTSDSPTHSTLPYEEEELFDENELI